MTAQEEFDEMVDCVMPDGLDHDSDQYWEMRRAFFGGIVVAYRSPAHMYEDEVKNFFALVAAGER